MISNIQIFKCIPDCLSWVALYFRPSPIREESGQRRFIHLRLLQRDTHKNPTDLFMCHEVSDYMTACLNNRGDIHQAFPPRRANAGFVVDGEILPFRYSDPKTHRKAVWQEKNNGCISFWYLTIAFPMQFSVDPWFSQQCVKVIPVRDLCTPPPCIRKQIPLGFRCHIRPIGLYGLLALALRAGLVTFWGWCQRAAGWKLGWGTLSGAMGGRGRGRGQVEIWSGGSTQKTLESQGGAGVLSERPHPSDRLMRGSVCIVD